jgi:hypothetical protein
MKILESPTKSEVKSKPSPPKSLEQLNPIGRISEPKRKRRTKAEMENNQVGNISLPPANIPIGAVRPMVSIPFSITARITKFKEFELSESEQDELAQAAKVCIDTYMPYILDKWLPLISLVMVAGSITMVKAKSYADYKSEQEKIKGAESGKS